MDQEIILDTESAKRAYNWFHTAFYPSYKDHDLCSPEDIMLRNKLERFLVEQEE